MAGRMPPVSIGLDEVEHHISMLELLYNLRPADEGELDELADSLSDKSFFEMTDMLAADPLFVHALQCKAPSEGLRSGELITGNASKRPRFLFVPHTGKPTSLISNEILLEPLRVIDDHLPVEKASIMRPLAFTAYGSALTLAEAGIFEEVVILLERGMISVQVGDETYDASASGGDSGSTFTCIAFCTSDQKRLPEIVVNVVGGQAAGLVVGYAPRQNEDVQPWRVQNNKIVGLHFDTVGESVIAHVKTIPTGQEAVDWAHALPSLFKEKPGSYAHDEAHKARHLSPRDPWKGDWMLRHIDVRVLLAPASMAGHRPFFAIHPNEEELLVMLAGSVYCGFGPDEVLPSQVNERHLDHIRADVPEFVPHLVALASSSSGAGVVEPPAVFFDSATPHSVTSASMNDAVCFHVVYSLIRNDRLQHTKRPAAGAAQEEDIKQRTAAKSGKK